TAGIAASRAAIDLSCSKGSSEELAQSVCSLFRLLFRKEMPSSHSASLNVVAPCAPDRQRSSLCAVPAIQPAARAPQGQKRGADASSGRAIGLVMLAIPRRGGAIFFADRVDVGRIAKGLDV